MNETGFVLLHFRADQIQTDVNWSPDGKSLLFGSLLFQNTPIYTIDLATKRVAPLPDSSGLFSPHWSPDGRHIAAITKAHRTLMLFDLTTRKWTQAYGYEMGGGSIGRTTGNTSTFWTTTILKKDFATVSYAFD